MKGLCREKVIGERGRRPPELFGIGDQRRQTNHGEKIRGAKEVNKPGAPQNEG